MPQPDLSSVYGSGRGAVANLKAGPLTVLDSQLGALYLSQLAGTPADARGFGSTNAMTSAKDFAAGAQQFTQALVTGSDGHQYVVIDFTAKDGDGAALLTQLDALGIQHGSSYGAMASGLLRVDQIGALQGVSDLAFARESFSVAHAGVVTTQADHAEHADLARLGLGVDGTGIKVGVLSDSFDTSGDLGPDGNPDTAAVDTLTGGAGHDVLNGGAQADTFVFTAPNASSSDEVVDFSKFQGDHVGLSAAGFGIASLADVDFVSGPTATPFEGKATLVYTAGDLYWDADGAGSGARVLLAHFDGNPALAATDFLLV